MIALCPLCHKEHAYGTRAPGDMVMCICGKVFSLPPAKPFIPSVIRCATCGGSVNVSNMRCEYCNGSVKPFDLTRFCCRCFAYLENEASFCSNCGAHAVRADQIPDESPNRCPHHNVALAGVPLGRFHGEQCKDCSGIWIRREIFKDLMAQEASKSEGLLDSPKAYDRDAPFSAKVQYLKCPECDMQMTRKNFGRVSGIIIDECLVHGVWLDSLELFALAKFIREAGLDRAKRMEAQDAQFIKGEKAKIAELDRRAGRSPSSDLLEGATAILLDGIKSDWKS